VVAINVEFIEFFLIYGTLDRDLMALLLKVTGHGITHDSEADKRNFCYGLLSAFSVRGG
jgi:hypothetical protein